MITRILQIVLVFSQVSQSDNHVRIAIGTRKIVRRESLPPMQDNNIPLSQTVLGILRACEVLQPHHLVNVLKSIKHLSMNVALLDTLQQANAIDIIVKILEIQEHGPHTTVRSLYSQYLKQKNLNQSSSGIFQSHLPNLLQLMSTE